MVRKIEDLRAATDAELIAEHDYHATHTVVGTAYYMDELNRRALVRLTKSNQRLALASFVMSAVSTAAAIAAVWIAVLAPQA